MLIGIGNYLLICNEAYIVFKGMIVGGLLSWQDVVLG